MTVKEDHPLLGGEDGLIFICSDARGNSQRGSDSGQNRNQGLDNDAPDVFFVSHSSLVLSWLVFEFFSFSPQITQIK